MVTILSFSITAKCNGVYPYLFLPFTFAPWLINNFIISILSFTLTALCNGVYPLMSFSFTLAPLLINNFMF